MKSVKSAIPGKVTSWTGISRYDPSSLPGRVEADLGADSGLWSVIIARELPW